MIRLLTPLFALLLITPAWAQPTTTVGTLTATPTFDTIWITATFTGDQNGNNSVTLQYRPSGSTTWLDAYSPPPDRRATVSGGHSNAANQNQFRSGVFSLTAGYSYDVRVTYGDADGVTGGPTLSKTVTLLSNATVVRSGKTYYVDDVDTNGDGSLKRPFNSLADALAVTACGDRLLVQPGTYAAFTFSKTCTATSWYVIEGVDRDTVLISDHPSQQILIRGAFVQLKNLRSPTTTCNGIDVRSTSHDVWIENVRMDDINTSVRTQRHSGSYACDGVIFKSGTYHGYVLNSQFYAPTLSGMEPAFPRWDSASSAIYFSGQLHPAGGFVVKGNTIGTTASNGAFRDCIGGDEGIPQGLTSSDILDNVITGCRDDAIQTEGISLNLQVSGNRISVTNGYTCFAAQSPNFGPIFWMRNTCHTTFSDGRNSPAAWKAGGMQFVFLFHNSVRMDAPGADCIADSQGVTTTSYIVAMNNIFECRANPLYRIYSPGTTFNYNLYYRPSGDPMVAGAWNGTENHLFTQFQSAAGLETNGSFDHPRYRDTALTIDNTSPAYNTGVPLPNINDAHSACPAKHGAPDKGAFEVGGCRD